MIAIPATGRHERTVRRTEQNRYHGPGQSPKQGEEARWDPSSFLPGVEAAGTGAGRREKGGENNSAPAKTASTQKTRKGVVPPQPTAGCRKGRAAPKEEQKGSIEPRSQGWVCRPYPVKM